MSGFDDARKAIETRLNDNYSRTDIAYDNDNYKPRKNRPFIRITIQDGDSDQITLGGSTQLHRRTGVIIVQIFTASKSGTGEAKKIADDVGDVFRSKNFSGVTTFSPTVNRIGESGEWFQINVVVPFWADEYH